MAIAKLKDICSPIRSKWDVCKIAIFHRVSGHRVTNSMLILFEALQENRLVIVRFCYPFPQMLLVSVLQLSITGSPSCLPGRETSQVTSGGVVGFLGNHKRFNVAMTLTTIGNPHVLKQMIGKTFHGTLTL